MRTLLGLPSRRAARLLTALAFALYAFHAGAQAAAYEVRGVVELAEGQRTLTTATELRRVVIAYRPDRGGELPASPESLEMATLDKNFFPEQLLVPLGGEVRFPNYDRILHNVFSVSGENRFDLGVYARDEGKRQRFEASGLVRVYCNVHRSMFAYILVLDTPFNGRPDDRGAFSFDGLPAGPGTLMAWHPQSEIEEMRISLPHAATIKVRLPLSGQKVPPHLNKFGRPYGRSRDRY